jgi:hypothetical protein
VLVFHPNELFRPTKVQSYIDAAELEQFVGTSPTQLPDDTYWRIVDTSPGPGDLPPSTPGAFYRLNHPCQANATLAGEACYAQAFATGTGGPALYGRVARTATRIVLQYWLFYYDNPLILPATPVGEFWQSLIAKSGRLRAASWTPTTFSTAFPAIATTTSPAKLSLMCRISMAGRSASTNQSLTNAAAVPVEARTTSVVGSDQRGRSCADSPASAWSRPGSPAQRLAQARAGARGAPVLEARCCTKPAIRSPGNTGPVSPSPSTQPFGSRLKRPRSAVTARLVSRVQDGFL